MFNLPGLPVKDGRKTRVYSNHIHDNNTDNFAPKGNIVATVPTGTGFMVLANDEVEFFDNRVENNRTANALILSFDSTGKPANDAAFDPYPQQVYIHDNKFAGGGDSPIARAEGDEGREVRAHRRSAGHPLGRHGGEGPRRRADADLHRANGDADFANIDYAGKLAKFSTDMKPHDCSCLVAAGELAGPGLVDAVQLTRPSCAAASSAWRRSRRVRHQGRAPAWIFPRISRAPERVASARAARRQARAERRRHALRSELTAVQRLRAQAAHGRAAAGHEHRYGGRVRVPRRYGDIEDVLLSARDGAAEEPSVFAKSSRRLRRGARSRPGALARNASVDQHVGRLGRDPVRVERRQTERRSRSPATRCRWSWSAIKAVNRSHISPDTNQCAGCHALEHHSQKIEPIGIRARHLNKTFRYGESSENQLAHWQKAGLLSGAPIRAPRNAVGRSGADSDLEARALTSM